MQSSESKGRRAAAQSAQSEGSSSSELDDQLEKDRYLSGVRFQAPLFYTIYRGDPNTGHSNNVTIRITDFTIAGPVGSPVFKW